MKTDILKKVVICFFSPIAILVNLILKLNNVFIIYRLGNAIGDQLCMTAIVEELYDQYKQRIIIISSYPELFEYNPKVYYIYHLEKQCKMLKWIVIKLLKVMAGEQIGNFGHPFGYGKFEKYMRDSKVKISLINAHSSHFKRKFDINKLKPKIYFSDDEKKEYEKKIRKFPQGFCIVQPVGKITYTPNKEWGFDKFQEVINATNNEIYWIQTGFLNDRLLQNVYDYRGKTNSLRELAYIISKAKFVFCLEGLLNHFSASVDTKSIVLFSGFHPIEISKYDTTISISKIPQVECSPCWLLTKCPKKKKWCTEDILVKDVIKVIKENV